MKIEPKIVDPAWYIWASTTKEGNDVDDRKIRPPTAFEFAIMSIICLYRKEDFSLLELVTMMTILGTTCWATDDGVDGCWVISPAGEKVKMVKTGQKYGVDVRSPGGKWKVEAPPERLLSYLQQVSVDMRLARQ